MGKLHTLSNLRDRIKVVAFDLDGTLYPNYQMLLISIPLFLKHPRFVRAFKKTRSEVRWVKSKEHIRVMQANILADYLGIPKDEAYSLIERIIYNEWEGMFRFIKPFRGVKEALYMLKSSGYRLAVLSDFPPTMKLGFLGLTDYFDIVLSSDDSGYLKPNRKAFEYLVEKSGVGASEILFVGNDYTYDIIGAKSTGMFTAYRVSFCKRAFMNTKLIDKADFVFSSYGHFMEIFRND